MDKYIDTFICDDALSAMKRLPDGCVDLVITSPPYNLRNSTGNGMKDGRGSKWSKAVLRNGYTCSDDNMPHEEYVAWQRECISEMLRVVSDSGAIFYNHRYRYFTRVLQNGRRKVGGGFVM